MKYNVLCNKRPDDRNVDYFVQKVGNAYINIDESSSDVSSILIICSLVSQHAHYLHN